jgi:hypothetical protein
MTRIWDSTGFIPTNVDLWPMECHESEGGRRIVTTTCCDDLLIEPGAQNSGTLRLRSICQMLKSSSSVLSGAIVVFIRVVDICRDPARARALPLQDATTPSGSTRPLMSRRKICADWAAGMQGYAALVRGLRSNQEQTRLGGHSPCLARSPLTPGRHPLGLAPVVLEVYWNKIACAMASMCLRTLRRSRRRAGRLRPRNHFPGMLALVRCLKPLVRSGNEDVANRSHSDEWASDAEDTKLEVDNEDVVSYYCSAAASGLRFFADQSPSLSSLRGLAYADQRMLILGIHRQPHLPQCLPSQTPPPLRDKAVSRPYDNLIILTPRKEGEDTLNDLAAIKQKLTQSTTTECCSNTSLHGTCAALRSDRSGLG